MLWRHLFRKKSSHSACSVEPVSDIPIGYALEARMLFDGAIVATAEQTTETQTTTSQTTTSQTTTTQTASADTATQSDNSHADGTTDQADTSSQHTSTQSATADSHDVAAVATGATAHKEVVFIDTSVADYQTLVDQVPAGTEVVLLDSSKDGLTQMAEWAQTHSGYDAIHIISHGSEGQVSLGTLTLNTTTAASRSADLATLGSALTEDGDLLLYGCDIGATGSGAFLQLLHETTGADIAASNDNTGAAALGGDWVLETSVGDIQAHSLSVSDYSHLLSTVTFVDGSQEDSDANSNNMFVRTIDGASFTFKAGSTITGKNASYLDIQEDTNPNYQTSGGGIGPGIYSLSDRNGGSGMDFEISVQSGYTFDVTGFETQLRTGTVTIYYVKDGVTSSFSLTPGADAFHTYSGLTTLNDVTSVVFTSEDYGLFQNIIITDVKTAAPKDSTSTLTAGAASEATTFSTTATSVGSATSLMDFTITDTGASDGVATTVSALYANVSGSATSSELSKMTFLLSGPDATNVAGTYDSSTGRVTFSGLNVSIADGGSETYTIKAYYNDNTSSNDITDHHTVVLSINASNVTTGSGSSTFAGAQSSVTNGSGASIDVAATQLIYSQSPSTSVVSGINFTTQPVVYAVDARGNIDTDFNGSVTLSENGSGSLTGTTQVTASNGIATFSGVKYTSASDADANFVLTAASASLASVTSASINPDVVATRLVFSTQPVPTTIQNGQSTSFTTVPVVQAVDANGMVDQDYTTNIVLSVTDPNDSVVDGTVNSLTVTSGDNDGSATTVTLTPSGGIATYTGLIIQYTNSGSSNTLALRATSVGLTAINSSSITSTTNTAPVFSNLNGGATYTENGSAVVIDNDVTVADTELNNQGNYNGASISIARNGGANSVDTFGNSGLLGTLTQGQNFTYNGTAVGSVTTNSSGTLTLTFNSNATSAIVNAVLQSLTYANTSDDPPASVTLNWTFNDGSLNSTGTNQAVLSITPVNDAPVISNTSVSKTFNEDSAQTFSAADFGFSDVDSGDTLQSITIVTAPTAGELFIDANSDGVRDSGDTLLGDGAVVSAANIGKLTFRPTANANGAGYASFTWKVSDGTALSGNTGTMTLNVTPVNDAPVISNTSVSKTLSEDSAQTFSAADFGFSDVDSGDTLQSITIVTGPGAGELFIDANNDGVRGGGDTLLGNGSVVSAADIGKLTFRPTANANGTSYTTFTWKVSDGTALSGNTGTMTLNVTPVNDAPTLSSGVTVTLTSTTEDVTSSATTVSSLLSNAGYGDVDSGASSGIAITATAGNGGWQYSTDSGANWFSIGTVSDSSALLLLAPNAQVRYVPDSANGETATLSFRAWDNTSGSATAGSSKGLADTSTTGGSSAFSTNSAQASLVVTSVNDAPTVGSPVSIQSATKDTAFSFTVPGGTFVDVDSGDTLTLGATQSDGSALPTWLSFNPSTRTFSGTPGHSDVGNLTIRITATDGSNASVSTTFGLTVNNSNLPPVVSNPVTDQSIAQNGSFNFTVPGGTFTDPDTGDTLTLSATQADGSALPGWLSFNPATRTFSGTPGNSDVGNLTIRVTATDGSNASVSTTFGLVVTNVNDAPVVSGSLGGQTAAQNGGFSFTVPAGVFTDPDTGDTLTLSATQADGSALPGWLSFNPATRTFSGTPGNGDVGNLTIRVTATDGSNASVSTTFGLVVTGSTVDNGDPEFRINGGTSVPPTATPVPVVTVAPAAPITLGALFGPTSLGALNAGSTADNATAASTIFQSAQRAPQVSNVPASQIASAFVQGAVSSSASLFESSLGSFPSFNTGGALGGSSSLAGVFSGMSLPSLSPMAVFSGGSWRDINTNSANTGRLTTPSGGIALQFAPGLEQQLQHIGNDTQQRLAAIEQALLDIGQITYEQQQG
ncbi:putative Ig domain-containing protein [Dickeya zeae]|uniref:putative Ig domain-containing protein n=1 Tax=Dickeya zeae TaxID=204042 RepID=UPI0003A471AC|nr:putative Ig domain-containing protein [Dickeya zeae]